MDGRCTIDGTILQLIFQNEENGYTVLRLVTTDGEAVTVVGTIPCAAPGENLIVTGRWVSHPVHGDQVQAEQVERHMPSSEEDIRTYLSSGIIKGVGAALADRLVQRFADPANYRGRTGAVGEGEGHHRPQGPGDRGELPLSNRYAAAAGVFIPQ